MSCCHCRGIQTLFSERVARHELKRNRRKGSLQTTRRLLDARRVEGG
jgi:hypothetical protein